MSGLACVCTSLVALVVTILRQICNRFVESDGRRYPFLVIAMGTLAILWGLVVLAGKVNKNLVNLIGTKGAKAVGISGMDGRLIEAKIKNKALGFVGEITNINIGLINDLLENGYIPVVSTIGCDSEGNSYNINGDTAAAYIAGALQAERLIMMTDIAGIMRDVNDPSSLISEITVTEAKKLYEEGVISGGMIPKVDCCIEAIIEGVKKVIIMDGRVPHSILVEILTDEGAGTMVVGD